jgi:predicted GTPase
MTNSRLCDTLLDLCAKVRPALEDDPAAAETVDAVIARLEERTLRIAVGGRLNAGKSTLVNAMLGQSLASTTRPSAPGR